MYNSDTELIFPPRVIPALRGMRGDSWNELIDQVTRLEPTALDRLAFVLLMVRLVGCLTCEADSFRALRGCTQCARQCIRRYRGSDQELFGLFSKARGDVTHFLTEERVQAHI